MEISGETGQKYRPRVIDVVLQRALEAAGAICALRMPAASVKQTSITRCQILYIH